MEEHITGAELLNNATWATAQPDANVTVLIPGFPGAVFLGTFVTGGYGPPARVIGVQTPKDCDSIVYIIDQVRADLCWLRLAPTLELWATGDLNMLELGSLVESDPAPFATHARCWFLAT